MLDNSLLRDFMDGFYGYGTYQAPFWFIGMEEGGGGSMDEIQRRLTAWDARATRRGTMSQITIAHRYHKILG